MKPPPPDPPPKRILVVDDDAAIRKIVSHHLDRAGHETVAEPSARDALDRLEHDRRFDLIISDLMMPRIDGIEFRRRLLAHPEMAHIPFLILTARKGRDDRITSYELDVDAYVTKPFDAPELMAQVNSILRVRENRNRYTSEERLRAIRQLTVTLNHEINNPLATVIGMVELHQRNPTRRSPEEINEIFASILHAGRRIRDVIQRVNQIRQIATKTYLSDIEMVDLDRASEGEENEAR